MIRQLLVLNDSGVKCAISLSSFNPPTNSKKVRGHTASGSSGPITELQIKACCHGDVIKHPQVCDLVHDG